MGPAGAAPCVRQHRPRPKQCDRLAQAEAWTRPRGPGVSEATGGGRFSLNVSRAAAEAVRENTHVEAVVAGEDDEGGFHRARCLQGRRQEAHGVVDGQQRLQPAPGQPVHLQSALQPDRRLHRHRPVRRRARHIVRLRARCAGAGERTAVPWRRRGRALRREWERRRPRHGRLSWPRSHVRKKALEAQQVMATSGSRAGCAGRCTRRTAAGRPAQP